MIGLDASAVVELLFCGQRATDIHTLLAERNTSHIAPHLLEVEVLSAIRRLTSAGQIDAHQIRQMLAKLATMPVELYAHTPLLGRIWELRHNFTAYDATYIALAESTRSLLLTCDEKLASGHKADVRVIPSS